MGLYCGIDLHTRNNQMAIVDEGGRLTMERRADNDLQEVLAKLRRYREKIVAVAVESTPNWYWLVDGLMEDGYTVQLANTWAAKQYEGLKYLDDRHDARWLATMLRLGILPQGHIYPPEQRAVRDLLRQRVVLMRHRTSMLLNMGAIYARQTGVRVTGYDIVTMTRKELEAALQQAEMSLALEATASVVRRLNEQIHRLETEVLGKAKGDESYDLLRTMVGVGPMLGMTIWLETGDIQRFAKVGNYASYCRCVRSEWRSNDKKKGKGLSKNGNPYLAWAFCQAAHFAARYDESARKFYQRKLAKTNWKVANSALANKLSRAAYWILRKREPFDPQRLFR